MPRTLLLLTLPAFGALSAAALWQDARATGRNVWPWIVLTLLGGSFGPLLYLLTRQPRPRAT
ncbi:MAG: hypothetical protein KA164_18295 [Rhodoferax sp.]|jgi:hypothetical protein|nr:hypothetical protein [Rhodoferax sp.]